MDEIALFLELFGLDEEEALGGLGALEAELPTCQWCRRTGVAVGKMGEVLVRVCDEHRPAGAKDLPFAKLLRALWLWRRTLKSERPTIPDLDEQRRRGHLVYGHLAWEGEAMTQKLRDKLTAMAARLEKTAASIRADDNWAAKALATQMRAEAEELRRMLRRN